MFLYKKALVTGAGQGIGHAISLELANRGANVVALSRSQDHLDKLKNKHPKIETICVNLEDWTATREIVSSLDDVSLLVNNAGTNVLEAFTNIKEETIDRKMIDNKIEGSVVNVSSQASNRGVENHTVYSASKAALDSLTRSMALELGRYNIRVNAVNPTVVMTELGKYAWSNPEKQEKMLSRIPLGKFAEVQDVVDSVLFLLSDAAKMITGNCLPVDGGFLIS